MAVRYTGHMVRTRQQAAALSVVMLLVLLPLAAWRFTTEPLPAAFALFMLTLAPFAIAYQSWRFLEAQERVHQQPTPEMIFVFRFVANTPLTFGGLLFIVLVALR
jgi:uncharacterized membrane protein